MITRIAVIKDINGRYISEIQQKRNERGQRNICWCTQLKSALWLDADGDLQFIERLFNAKTKLFSHIEIIELYTAE